MAERVLKGSRLGATSYETDRNTDLAPRREVRFDCPRGHTFDVPMASDADLPSTWECKVCGAVALRHDGVTEEPKQGKHVRTHWDMLRERRSLEELEVVLAERLAELHSRQPRRKSA